MADGRIVSKLHLRLSEQERNVIYDALIHFLGCAFTAYGSEKKALLESVIAAMDNAFESTGVED